jgi:hypothetical protein
VRELDRYVDAELLGLDPLEDPQVLAHDDLRCDLVHDVLAQERRVRMEALLVQPAEDLDALVERLAGDEA